MAYSSDGPFGSISEVSERALREAQAWASPWWKVTWNIGKVTITENLNCFLLMLLLKRNKSLKLLWKKYHPYETKQKVVAAVTTEEANGETEAADVGEPERDRRIAEDASLDVKAGSPSRLSANVRVLEWSHRVHLRRILVVDARRTWRQTLRGCLFTLAEWTAFAENAMDTIVSDIDSEACTRGGERGGGL